MFLSHQVEIRDAEIYSSMPDKYRRTGVASEWAKANRGGTAVDSFLEGPVFDTAGNLYVTDIPFGRIFKISPDRQWTLIVEYDGEPNGMKFLGEGQLVIADYKNGLMRLDLARREVRPYLSRRNTERFKGVNDLIFDTAGNLYFTDQGQSGLHDPSGRVYRLARDGRLDLLLHNVPSPNGIALSPDEKVLYVAATRGNCIWRAPLMADGSVAKVGQFFTSHGPSGPDGLAVDQAGRLIIANPGLGRVWVLNELAEPDEVWRSPRGKSLTNIAFGGPDGKTLYCTESTSGSILAIPMQHAGVPLAR
ncbi:SMP-30/gluconolactonase/LRE family protein [Candidimonas nitroreducens]|uniref:Gluconolactonase n=1 Tax=Candidimonas nitroreducens TaxID=683354 RepID=A0A225MWB0_9BURK|nr:SMP-30/gluconolactonase/LRE family protein [Candidimonas nitroreducens]OWT64100.1 gluconolactonase [Candidimonas nitroreducens]